MEKTSSPSEKSGNFATLLTDTINSVNPSSSSSSSSLDQSQQPNTPSSNPNTQSAININSPAPTESPKVDIDDAIITTEQDQLPQADSENTQEEEEEKTSDSESNLAKLSEEIDQFLTLLSSSSDPNTIVDDQDSPPDDKDNAAPPPSLPEIPISIEKFLNLIEAEILNQESSKEPEKWLQEDSKETPNLLQSINRISKLTKSLQDFHSHPDYSVLIHRTGTVLHKSMVFLEEEFQSILEDSRVTETESIVVIDSKTKKQSSFKGDHSDRCVLPEPGSSGDVKFNGYTSETKSNLKKIATTMISSGYEIECCQIYSSTRRIIFEDSLNKLGFEKISIDDIQKMQWESLESAISTWIKTFKRCVSVHFPGELELCQSIFADYNQISATLYSNLIRVIIIQLVNFVEAVAMTKRSAEKLFKLLDIYETLTPLMDEIFINEFSNDELKSDYSSARCRIGEAIVSIFYDLENSIKSDMSKQPVPGGAVHPLTRYTMNYLKYVCEYKDTLEQVFYEHKKIDRFDSEVVDSENNNDTPTHKSRAEPQSPFAVQIMNVMDLLDSNLDSKAKLYKDISLSYIFLMNNGRYIMQKIKGADINQLMGDNWSRKRSSDLRQYHKNYQRETWSKVLSCLRDDGGLQVNGKVSKPVLKEKFKSFNSLFDEIHKTQSMWVVSDEQLQSELRVSISAVMIPAYRSFLGRFSQYLDPGRQTEKYIKYGPEDIETSIDELFDGNPASIVRRRT